MNNYTEEECNIILKQMTPHKDYKIDDYYGVAIMERMADGTYDVKVIHSYISTSGKSKFSSNLNVKDWSTAIKIHDILQIKATKKFKTITALDLNSILSSGETQENSFEKKEEVEEVEEEVILDEDRDANLEDKIQSFKHPLDPTLNKDEAQILWDNTWDEDFKELYKLIHLEKEGELDADQEVILIKARASYQEESTPLASKLASKPF